MPVTPNYSIPYPDGTSSFTPLQQRFADLALGVDSALTTGVGGAPRLANSNAERNTIFPAPVQGNSVLRPDLGYTERYFGTYNATTNPAGANPAGWYPSGDGFVAFVGNALASAPVPNATSITVGGTGTNAMPYTELYDPYGWHNSSTLPERITPTIPGLYELSFSPAWSNNGAGNRSINISKNGTLIPSMSSVTGPQSTLGGGANVAIVELSGTDYITATMAQSSGTTLSASVNVKIELKSPRRS